MRRGVPALETASSRCALQAACRATAVALLLLCPFAAMVRDGENADYTGLFDWLVPAILFYAGGGRPRLSASCLFCSHFV